MKPKDELRQGRSPALAIACELESAGRYSKALQALERGTVRHADKRAADVLRAQLLERIGKYNQSRSVLDSLFAVKDLSHADRSVCELVTARLDWDAAAVDSAILHLQRSIDSGKQAGDLCLICWSQLRLLWILRDKSGAEAVSALFSELRANATKLGSAAVLSALHIFIGQMEAQRGLFASARRHVRIGLQMLSGNPNLWLEATAENVKFGVSLLLSDLDVGLEQGMSALRLAEESGAASTIGTSLGNLGNYYYMLGEFDHAIDYHQRALALVSSGGENWNAGLESIARIRLAQDRVVECSDLLDEIDQVVKTESDRRRYVYRHAQFTRARLLNQRHEYRQGFVTVESVLKTGNEAGDHLLVSLALILKAELFAKTGDVQAALTILNVVITDLPGLPPELHAGYERVLAVALSKSGLQRESEAHFERAERICTALRNVPCLMEVSRSRRELGSLENFRTSYVSVLPTERGVLQTVASLLLHHDRPEILAHETVSLLKQTAAATSAKATRRMVGDESDIIAGFNGSEDSSPTIHREFRVGIVGDRVFETQVTCEPDVESVATLNAVTILLNTIHELERGRAEREDRATLWPIEELPVEHGNAILTGHMREVMGLARRIATTNVTVLITGESGTGKEIVARALHAYSARADKPFIPFNCAAIPHDMLESQLFGHRRGSFTGADRDQPGVIRSARDGTLFLDEIGEMGIDLQPKILRFLESGEIAPLGEPGPITVPVRLVAATNAHLETLVRSGRFREDLYYRLNVFRLTIRPLRERRDEIPSLVNAFVIHAAVEFRKGQMRIAEETMEHLILYPWPGNVRQLLNETRRMVALAEPNSVLTPADISTDIRATLPAFPTLNADGRQIAVPLHEKLLPTLSKIEREMIRLALRDHGGKVDAAAKALGISRKGLYLKRQRLGL